MAMTRGIEVYREKLVQMLLCPQQISHGLNRNRPRPLKSIFHLNITLKVSSSITQKTVRVHYEQQKLLLFVKIQGTHKYILKQSTAC